MARISSSRKWAGLSKRHTTLPQLFVISSLTTPRKCWTRIMARIRSISRNSTYITELSMTLLLSVSHSSSSLLAYYSWLARSVLSPPLSALSCLLFDMSHWTWPIWSTDIFQTGEDSALEPDQNKPHVGYIKELLASASGKDKEGNVVLTIEDISKFSSKRRADARGYNKDFSLDTIHKIFGSTKPVLFCIFLCLVASLILNL